MDLSHAAVAVTDIAGTALTSEEEQLLAHPALAGVILFTRNYTDAAQLSELCASIRRARRRHTEGSGEGAAAASSLSGSRADVMILVDHEGGLVQRFRGGGLTRLPPAAAYRLLGGARGEEPLESEGVSGACAPSDTCEEGEEDNDDGDEMAAAGRALAAARAGGYVMAAELLACGVDASLAPVLDLDRGCPALRTRCFARGPRAVAALAGAFADGMRAAGMRAGGKHFPGHGSVGVDTHTAAATDGRTRQQLQAADLAVFARMIQTGGSAAGGGTSNASPDLATDSPLPRRAALDWVMPSHVVYPCVDPAAPASASAPWLRGVLRGEMGFAGLIFSDDVFMRAADGIGIGGEEEEARAPGAGGGVQSARTRPGAQNHSAPQYISPYGRRAGAMAEAGCNVILACRNQRGTAGDLHSVLDALLPLATDAEYAALVAAIAPTTTTVACGSADGAAQEDREERGDAPSVGSLQRLQQTEEWKRSVELVSRVCEAANALSSCA